MIIQNLIINNTSTVKLLNHERIIWTSWNEFLNVDKMDNLKEILKLWKLFKKTQNRIDKH